MANPIPYTRVPHNPAKQHLQTQALAMSLRKNDTTLVAMTSGEFLDYAIAVKTSQGMSRREAVDWLEASLAMSSTWAATKQSWAHYKEKIKTGGSFLPVLLDLGTLRTLAVDLHKGGSAFSKYRVNYHGGKAYMVIAGYAGLREHLTSSRYLANSPKVVTMGIGKLGVADAIKTGLKVSVIFTVAFHAPDQLMNDEATWHTLVAGVTTDVVAAVTGGTIAWTIVALHMGGAAAMAAVGPVVAVVIVGIVATSLLNYVASEYEIADRVAKRLVQAEERFLAGVRDMKNELRKGLTYADEDPVGFMSKLFGVPYFGRFK